MTLDEPALRPGAGHRHDRQLRRRARGLRAVADRAAGRRARARVPRRSALQRAELLAQLRAHARATRARLRAPDRRERRDGEGSEDLRAQRVPDRPLSRARRRASTRRTARSRTRRADAGAALLTALGTIGYYVAYAYIAWRTLARRVHDRRPHVPRRLVPAPAQPARRPAHRVLAGGRTGALPRRPVLVLRDRAGDRLAAESASVPGADPRAGSRSRTSASATRAPSAGRCAT